MIILPYHFTLIFLQPFLKTKFDYWSNLLQIGKFSLSLQPCSSTEITLLEIHFQQDRTLEPWIGPRVLSWCWLVFILATWNFIVVLIKIQDRINICSIVSSLYRKERAVLLGLLLLEGETIKRRKSSLAWLVRKAWDAGGSHSLFHVTVFQMRHSRQLFPSFFDMMSGK